MQKLENFIDKNINDFLQLEESEVQIYDISDFDNDIIEYLKLNYRFDYKNICVCYAEGDDFDEEGIWVENMSE
jgi:hypothetical protein